MQTVLDGLVAFASLLAVAMVELVAMASIESSTKARCLRNKLRREAHGESSEPVS